jgi:hypothetical protein
MMNSLHTGRGWPANANLLLDAGYLSQRRSDVLEFLPWLRLLLQRKYECS